MDGESNSLEALLNKEVKAPPTSEAEIQARLVARSGSLTVAPPDPAPTSSSEANDRTLDAAPVPISGSAADRETWGQDHSDHSPLGDPSGASLAEITAALSKRARGFAIIDEMLSERRFTTTAFDGRVKLVSTGHGRPVSLHIDTKVFGRPEQYRLGPVIARLIMESRERANLTRARLEKKFLARLREQDPKFGDT